MFENESKKYATELKQEAIQYACDYPFNPKGYKRVDIRKAYIAGGEKLIKAKEILIKFIKWAEWQGNGCPKFTDIKAEAEQFLKECEE